MYGKIRLQMSAPRKTTKNSGPHQNMDRTSSTRTLTPQRSVNGSADQKKMEKPKKPAPSKRGTEMVTVYCEPDTDDEEHEDDEDFEAKEESDDGGNQLEVLLENALSTHPENQEVEQFNQNVVPTVEESTTGHEQAASQKLQAKESEKERRTFMLHKSFACHYSPFLDRAFNGQFSEAKTNSITVKADPDTFSILVDWMYTQNLQNSAGDTPNGYELIDLWILADMFLMPELQNQALTLYYKKTLMEGKPQYDDGFYEGVPELVWRNTLPGSPLRELLIRNYAWNYVGSDFLKYAHIFPQEMLIELAQFNSDQLETYAGRRLPFCSDMWSKLNIKSFYVSEELPKRR